jgi:hypothetical protein
MEMVMVNCRVDKNIKQKVPQVHLVRAIDPLEKKSMPHQTTVANKNTKMFQHSITK